MENIRDKWAFSNGNWTISIRNKKTSKEKTMVRIEMQLTEEEVAKSGMNIRYEYLQADWNTNHMIGLY